MSVMQWFFGSPKYQIFNRLFGTPWAKEVFDTREESLTFLRGTQAGKLGYVWIGDGGLEIRKVYEK